MATTGQKATGWAAIAAATIAVWEGCYNYAYRDPVGVPTICFGVTAADRPVSMGDYYTLQECKDMLAVDIQRYKAMVDRCIRVAMPAHRTAAIVSFTYNVGETKLCASSVARDMNAGNVQQACDDLMKYDKAMGVYLPGLHNRRVDERRLCMMED